MPTRSISCRKTGKATRSLLVLVLAVSLSVFTVPPAATASTVGGLFTSLQLRLANSQTATGGLNGTLPANTWKTIDITTDAGLSASTTGAVEVTFTALAPAADGYLQAFADDVTPGAANALNFSASDGKTSNDAVVALSAAGKIKILVSAATDLIIDLQGYYTRGSGTAPGGYVPVTPTQIASTTDGSGGFPASRQTVNTTNAATITGVAAIPTSASAVMLLTTESNSGSTAGGMTVYPGGSSTPPAATINWPVGDTTSWTMPIAVDSSAKAKFLLRAGGPADVTVFVVGYFTSSTNGSDQVFTAMQQRVVDTKNGADSYPPLASGETRSIEVSGQGNIPTIDNEPIDVFAVDLHAVPSGSTVAGDLSIFSGDADSGPSVVYFSGPDTRSNMTFVRAGANGDINVTNNGNGPVDIVVDVDGWFDAPASTAPTPPSSSIDAAASDSVTATGATDSIDASPIESDAQVASDNAAAGGVPADDSGEHDLTADDPNLNANASDEPVETATIPDSVTTDGAFPGIPDDGIPPADPSAADLNRQVVETVNSQINVYNEGGAVQWRRSLVRLFHTSQTPYDPHVIVVPSRKRFAVTAIADGKLQVIYTQTAAFTRWCRISVAPALPSTGAKDPDFDLVGANNRFLWITSTLNDDENHGPSSNSIVRVSLNGLQSCSGFDIHRWNGLKDPGTTRLTQTLTPSVEYRGQNFETFFSKYSGTGNHVTAHYVVNGSPDVMRATSTAVNKYYLPVAAPQPGTPVRLDGDAGEATQSIDYQGGTLVCFTTWEPNVATNGVRWYTFAINFSANAMVVIDHRQFDATVSNVVLYPTGTEVSDGSLAFTFDISSSTRYQRSVVVRYNSSHQMSSSGVFFMGNNSYRQNMSSGTARWGDFSSILPAGQNRFIAVDETVPQDDKWGTRIRIFG